MQQDPSLLLLQTASTFTEMAASLGGACYEPDCSDCPETS